MKAKPCRGISSHLADATRVGYVYMEASRLTNISVEAKGEEGEGRPWKRVNEGEGGVLEARVSRQFSNKQKSQLFSKRFFLGIIIEPTEFRALNSGLAHIHAR